MRGVDDTIVALTPQTWDLFADLVERQGGLFGNCWCRWFHADHDAGVERDGSSRAFKRRMVDEGVAHAALVVRDAEAVAWAEYGTPEELPSIHHRKQYDTEVALGAPSTDWRVTCIQVDKRFRKQGLAEAALRGALDLIAAAGGGVVEGYPHDLAEKKALGKKTSSSFLYNGTRTMYERVGFAYDRPKGMGNCVMRLEVAPVIGGRRTPGSTAH